MINFDFTTMVGSFVDKDRFNDLFYLKEKVFSDLNVSYMNGWTKRIDESIVNEILKVRDEVKSYSKCLVVIGIGGSFLGSYSVKEMLSNYFDNNIFPVIYAGTTLSSKYIKE